MADNREDDRVEQAIEVPSEDPEPRKRKDGLKDEPLKSKEVSDGKDTKEDDIVSGK